MATLRPSVVQASLAASAPPTSAAHGHCRCSGLQTPLFSRRTALKQSFVKSAVDRRRSRQLPRIYIRAAEDSSASAGSDSIVGEVALLEEEPPTPGVNGGADVAAKPKRPPGALQKGGTLSGKEALGKDPGKATLGQSAPVAAGGSFQDSRWKAGNWDFVKFQKDGKVDWDAVIDAEVRRRKWLEDNPEASSNDEPVVFETAMVPWWAWVKRFHLPEAELLNGRAAMVGYLAAYIVDSLTGAGLVDQQNSFLGKLLLWVTIGAVLVIRKNGDLDTIKNLVKESTFYDKQWQASWKEDSTKEETPGV